MNKKTAVGSDKNLLMSSEDFFTGMPDSMVASAVPRRNKKKIAPFFMRLVSRTMQTEIDPYDVRAVQVLSLFGFSLVGIVATTVFGLVNLSNGEWLIGSAELAFAYIIAINLLIFRLHKRMDIAALFILQGIISIMVVIVMEGGIAGTAAFWTFVFPISAYLLTNKRLGFLWSTLFICLMAFIGLADARGLIDSHYSPIAIRQLVAALITSTFLVSIYESAASRSRETAIKKTLDLKKAYDRLKAETSAREQAQEETAKLLKEATKRNTILERLKLAMANLLEDVQSEKLTVEKVSSRDEALIGSIGEGIITTDANNVINVVNDRALEMLRVKKEDLVGSRLVDTIHYRHPDGKKVSDSDRPAMKAVTTQKVISGDFLLERKDGTTLNVGVTAAPFLIDGKAVGSVTTIHDRTKEAEIDKAKSEFVSLASHQLRTPLTAIKWYLEIIESDKSHPLSKTQEEYLKEVQKASERMVALISSFLNVSRIDLGTFLIEPKPTDVVEITQTVAEELEASIKSKKQTLTKEFPDHLPKFNFDPKLIYIIIQNLLSNAVKYTPAEGKISISVELDKKDVVIKVSDTGYGIPKKQQFRIFSKLFRADNVVSQDTEGTGLGLYVVKAIIDSVGGKIGFVSELDKGSTFTVRLPKSGMKSQEGNKLLNVE